MISAASVQPPVHFLMALHFTLSHCFLFAVLLCVGAVMLRGIYNRYFHPLRNFPGPFWGGVTDFYKLYIFASTHIPSATMELHQKYGPYTMLRRPLRLDVLMFFESRALCSSCSKPAVFQ